MFITEVFCGLSLLVDPTFVFAKTSAAGVALSNLNVCWSLPAAT